jgi:hypothetical protein
MAAVAGIGQRRRTRAAHAGDERDGDGPRKPSPALPRGAATVVPRKQEAQPPGRSRITSHSVVPSEGFSESRPLGFFRKLTRHRVVGTTAWQARHLSRGRAGARCGGGRHHTILQEPTTVSGARDWSVQVPKREVANRIGHGSRGRSLVTAAGRVGRPAPRHCRGGPVPRPLTA